MLAQYAALPPRESSPKGGRANRVSQGGTPSRDGPVVKGSLTPYYAALFVVAALWGTYAPALRYLFMSPHPPSPALLNAMQACLSAIFLAVTGLAAALAPASNNLSDPPSSPLGGSSSVLQCNPLAAEAAALAALASKDASPRSRTPDSTPSWCEATLVSALNWQSTDLLTAGCELGTWQVLAYGLEVAGLEHVSASKASFLYQTTVLITPLLVHLSGDAVQQHEWAACGLGLMGAVLVALDSVRQLTGREDKSRTTGYDYIIGAAFFYAVSTVRIGRYSTQFPALKLSIASTTVVATLAVAWVVASVHGSGEGWAHTLTVLHAIFSTPVCLTVVLWIGLGPGALASFLQARGQAAVPAAQAQLIYATMPLWATMVARLTLDARDEAMGLVAWAGAGLMLGASLLAAMGPGGVLEQAVGSSGGVLGQAAGSSGGGAHTPGAVHHVPAAASPKEEGLLMRRMPSQALLPGQELKKM